MARRNQIENNLCRIGQMLNIRYEDIKMTLNNKRGLLVIASIIIATLIANDLNSVCLKYLPPGPQDFTVFNNFPFSLLF